MHGAEKWQNGNGSSQCMFYELSGEERSSDPACFSSVFITLQSLPLLPPVPRHGKNLKSCLQCGVLLIRYRGNSGMRSDGSGLDVED